MPYVRGEEAEKLTVQTVRYEINQGRTVCNTEKLHHRIIKSTSQAINSSSALISREYGGDGGIELEKFFKNTWLPEKNFSVSLRNHHA